jgi:hypothetical protein
MAAHSLGTTVVAGTGEAIASVDGQSISICMSVRKTGGRDRLDTGCAGWKVQPGLLVRLQLVEAACVTVYEVRTSRALSQRSSLHSMSAFHTGIH